MQGTRILLLEDETSFAQNLLRFLQQVEPTWKLEWMNDPQPAMGAMLAGRHDAALIDWNLGKVRSGLGFCRDLRRVLGDTALVILSAREDVEDRVLAMQAGADDFITKRAEPMELRARVHVALARAADRRGAPESATLSCGPLRVHLLKQKVFLNERAIELTRHQWLLLVRLMQQPGEAVPPRELCHFAGIQGDLSHQNLRTEVRRLRQRLGEAGSLIRALRGQGYGLKFTETQDVGNDT